MYNTPVVYLLDYPFVAGLPFIVVQRPGDGFDAEQLAAVGRVAIHHPPQEPSVGGVIIPGHPVKLFVTLGAFTELLQGNDLLLALVSNEH